MRISLSSFSLSLIFFRPFLRIARSFFPFNLACVGNVRPFFLVCSCFFLFCFCLQKFSLILSSHLGASSCGRILKFRRGFAFACLFLFISWGGFFFCFFGGVCCWRCRRCRSGFGFWGLVDADGCFGSEALLLYYCMLFFPDSFILLLI